MTELLQIIRHLAIGAALALTTAAAVASAPNGDHPAAWALGVFTAYYWPSLILALRSKKQD